MTGGSNIKGHWTAWEDGILLRLRPRQPFPTIVRNYLPGRTASAAQKRYELLIRKGHEKPRPDYKSCRPPEPKVEKLPPTAYASRQLYHAMLLYGLRHGHLLSISMAQIRCRAKAEGVII